MAKDSRQSDSASSGNTALPVLLSAAFLILALVYCYCLFSESFGENARRAFILRLLLIPDLLLSQWFANDISRFGIFDRLPIVMLAALVLAVGWLIGRLLLDVLRVDCVLNPLERFVFASGIGLSVLSLCTLGFGLAGQLRSRWWFVTIALTAVIISAFRWKSWQALSDPETEVREVSCTRSTWLGRASFWFVAPFAAVILLGGMLPPWQFDVREYHLQIPKEWYQQGYIGFVPHNVYGNMPLGAEMHALLGMILMSGEDAWWWGALVGKTVIAIFAPLSALTLYAMGRRFVSANAGAVAAFVFISTPWVAHVSMAGLIDGVSAFYFLSAVYAVLLSVRLGGSKSSGTGPATGICAVAGFLAGSAVACKYPAVLFVVFPLLVWICLVPRGRFHWRCAGVFLLATLVSCGGWLGKNWVLSGNPTYPLLYEWFDGETRTPEKHAQWVRAHRTPENGMTVGHLRDSLYLLAVRSDFISPLLLPFAFVGLFVKRHRRLVMTCVALCVYVFAVWWLFTHRVDRFLLPALPLAALVAGIGATWSAERLWQRCAFGLLLFGLVFNLVFDVTRFPSDNRYLVALDELREDLPVEKDDYAHLHPNHFYLNHAVRKGYQVMAVGEAQVFNIDVPVLYNTCFDDCVFEQLLRGRSRDECYAVLRENRISHLLFFWLELDRYRSPGNYGYSDYVTRDLVRRVLVREQQLLRKVPLNVDPEISEVYEVVGWRDW